MKEITRLEEQLQAQAKPPSEVGVVKSVVNHENILNKKGNGYLNLDPLSIALEVREKYWSDYPSNKKSSSQIKKWIKKEYKISTTLAEHIEISEKALELMSRRVEKFFQKNFFAFLCLNFRVSNRTTKQHKKYSIS